MPETRRLASISSETNEILARIKDLAETVEDSSARDTILMCGVKIRQKFNKIALLALSPRVAVGVEQT